MAHPPRDAASDSTPPAPPKRAAQENASPTPAVPAQADPAQSPPTQSDPSQVDPSRAPAAYGRGPWCQREQSRHNVERRHDVERVALELFAREGFDAVTIEQVAAAAGIAPATFYRYFRSKEGVLASYESGFVAAAADIGRQPDPDQPAMRQVYDMLERCAAYFAGQADIRLVRHEVVLLHTALTERRYSLERNFQDALAEAMADRRGESTPSSATSLEAAMCVTVLRLAIADWRNDEQTPLSEHVDRVFGVLQSRFSE